MTSLRLLLASILLCGFAYTAGILGFARKLVPERASGSLVLDARGKPIGSRLLAQSFSSARYFHPRPSACDFNARAAAGSNLSPAHPKLAERAADLIARHAASPARPIPADLVTASGSGLDPDITTEAALYQAERVARARGLDPGLVRKAVEDVHRPLMGRFGGPRLVNVLELNLALDRISR